MKSKHIIVIIVSLIMLIGIFAIPMAILNHSWGYQNIWVWGIQQYIEGATYEYKEFISLTELIESQTIESIKTATILGLYLIIIDIIIIILGILITIIKPFRPYLLISSLFIIVTSIIVILVSNILAAEYGTQFVSPLSIFLLTFSGANIGISFIPNKSKD